MIDETVLNLNLQTFVVDNIPSNLQNRVKHCIRKVLNNDNPWEKTVKELVSVPMARVATVKGVGKITLRNLGEALANFGLHLGMTEAEMFRASAVDTGEDAALVERTLLAIERMFPCLRFSEMDRVRVKAVVLKSEPNHTNTNFADLFEDIGEFEEYYN